MRTKKAFKNALMSLLLQIVVAVSGILIPRFFIELYGSSVNGLVASISQFISYMALVEAGVGTAGTVALYKPIADGNQLKMNGILSAAKSFYYRSGLFFLGMVIALVVFYPFAVKNEIGDVSFVRSMIVILSLNGVVDYFYLGKYRVLLTADQKGYVISLAQIIGTVVMTAVCIVLMEIGVSALLVKGINAVIYILRSFFVGFYVRHKYPEIRFNGAPNFKAYDQRWAALFHQIIGMVVNNTAVVLLTLMVEKDALIEVSIYSVYNMVAYSLYNVMNSISTGLSSGFGEVIAKKETDILTASFKSYEYIFLIIIFIAYSCMAVLLYPFINLYSASFTGGGVYLRWSLVAMFTLVGLLQAIRMPSFTLIMSAGHYKQTRVQAIIEVAINISISVCLVKPLGIVGILLGALCSYLYRTTEVIIYSAKHFISGSLQTTFRRIIRNIVASMGVVFCGIRIVPMNTESWLMLVVSAIGFGLSACIVIVGINCVFEPKEFKTLLNRARGILGKG